MSVGLRTSQRTLLLETKLVEPAVRGGTVRRARLLAELDETSTAALTLVAAPAGYGKTTLLSTWASAQRLPVIWVTLDPNDRDPVRLWTHVAAAASRASRGLGSRALEQLAAPAATVDAAVDTLMTALASHGGPMAIVLDDVDSIGSGESIESIERAILQLPVEARLVAAGRADPPIRLAHLRGRHALAEIRADRLAFTADEARELLVRHEGVGLTDDSIDLLMERTEGWPAAIYLAALWLRASPTPNEAAREFGASSRQVSDYLTEEVLRALDDDLRSFLSQTALLRRFTPELCDAALERTDSREILAKLERSNFLLVPLGAHGTWYRYHSLFEELMLLKPSTAETGVLHLRAAAWSREQGYVEDAVTHAAEAGDWNLVAELLVEAHPDIIWRGGLGFLRSWAERLPQEVLLEWPPLLATAALAAVLAGRPPIDAERLLSILERARQSHPERWSMGAESEYAITRSLLAGDDAHERLRAARAAVEAAEAADDRWIAGAIAALTVALFFVGELEEARQAALRLVTLPEAEHRPHGFVVSLGILALIDAEQGRSAHAEAWATQALNYVRAHGQAQTWFAAPAHLGLSAAYAQMGRPGDAEREAARGEELWRKSGPSHGHAYALLHLGDRQIARSRRRLAKVTLEAAQREIAEFPDPGRLPELAAQVEARLDAEPSSVPELVEQLSPAELAVLQHLRSDLSQREIAERLYLPVNTVRTHLRRIYRKLNVGTREAAVARAEELDLLDTTSHQGDSPR